jgi:uncharacterized protein YfaP (DUF2135 family)
MIVYLVISLPKTPCNRTYTVYIGYVFGQPYKTAVQFWGTSEKQLIKYASLTCKENEAAPKDNPVPC